MLLIRCDSCGAHGFTDDGECPDAAVECGCCAEHATHGEHVAHVQVAGEASCRPVTIILLPESVKVS